MKKIIHLLIACVLIMMISTSFADTICPRDSTLQMDNLANQAVLATIDEYDETENNMTVSLFVPEVFSEDDILNLEIGDLVFSQGRQYVVESITEDFPYTVINRGQYYFSDGSLWFDYDPYGNFSAYIHDEAAKTKIGSLTFALPEELIFLDGITSEIGMPLSIPTVHTAHEFVNRYIEEKQNKDVGFSCNNVYIVFNSVGQPAIIYRFYVSWQ